MIFLCVGALLIAVKIYLADFANGSTDSMFLRLYNKDSSFLDVNIRDAEQLVPQLKSNEMLVMYIHGYKENTDYEGPRVVTEAYLASTDHNILAVDYREVANMSYLGSVASVGDVGKAIAGALDTIIFSNANTTKVHIIGHSLGSQVAGSAARQTSFLVDRVTGLDPAGPLFYLINRHLSARDAAFVDIIHTDRGLYGMGVATGHVDFFPNGGHRPQAGCSLFGPILTEKELCSHHRSYMFYAESVKRDDFVGVKCASKWYIFRGKCNQSDVAVMGYRTPSNIRGNYFLQTEAKSPYGKGLNGIQSYLSESHIL